jgi:hypothetical protein
METSIVEFSLVSYLNLMNFKHCGTNAPYFRVIEINIETNIFWVSTVSHSERYWGDRARNFIGLFAWGMEGEW